MCSYSLFVAAGASVDGHKCRLSENRTGTDRELLLGQGEPGLRYTLFHLRLPRVFTSMLVGMGLAGSGAILQGVSRNPMAEPGILGINAGGGLFLALFLVFFREKRKVIPICCLFWPLEVL